MFETRLAQRARIAALKEIELFSDCSGAELRAIDSMRAEVAFRSGKKLTCEGVGGLEFVIIVAGGAMVTRGGKEHAALGPGSFFGEMSLLTGAARVATVVAATSMRGLVWHAGEFANLLEMPSVNSRILRTAAERTVTRPRFRMGRQIADSWGIPA